MGFPLAETMPPTSTVIPGPPARTESGIQGFFETVLDSGSRFACPE